MDLSTVGGPVGVGWVAGSTETLFTDGRGGRVCVTSSLGFGRRRVGGNAPRPLGHDDVDADEHVRALYLLWQRQVVVQWRSYSDDISLSTFVNFNKKKRKIGSTEDFCLNGASQKKNLFSPVG